VAFTALFSSYSFIMRVESTLSIFGCVLNIPSVLFDLYPVCDDYGTIYY